MKLSEKIPVPELDELRLLRLERSIVAEAAAAQTQPVSGTGRLWKGAVAMVAVAGVVLLDSMHPEQYELVPIAVHATRSRSSGQIGDQRGMRDLVLRSGDVLLIQGQARRIQDLRATGQVLLLDTAVDLPHTEKAGTAMAIMTGVTQTTGCDTATFTQDRSSTP